MAGEGADEAASSYRQIIRSSSIMGGASAINILMGIARLKVAALLLGPVGVGLIGLFQNLMATASVVASVGLGNVGSRQVAEAATSADEARLAAARRALFWWTLGLAIVGTAALWLLRGVIARHLLDDASLADEVGWLSIGVGLGIAAGSQIALLTGLRRIGDVARVSIASAVLTTGLGVAIMLWLGERGIIAFVLLTPATGLLAGWYYAAKLPGVAAAPTRVAHLARQWRVMAGLGLALMIGGIAALVGPLAVRILIHRELGAAELGHFQAAWLVSMTYLGFVLQAMSTDYYPRLTAAIRDHRAANRLINEQTEVALLLAGPAFLLMLGAAPWVLQLLYSAEFVDAAAILRWQILGDVLKITCWPLGFLLLSLGDGRTFVAMETSTMTFFVLLSGLGIPLLGVEAAGLAFMGMYALYLPLLYLVARRRTGFRWTSRVKLSLAALACACALVLAMSVASAWGGLAAGFVLAAAGGIIALRQLGDALPSRLRAALAFAKRPSA